MSFLFEQRASELNALDRLMESRFGTSSGQRVTNQRALRHAAVWGSLATISEAYLGLPLQEQVRVGPNRFELRDPPAWIDEPAPGVPWESWIWQQVWTLAARGRCYAQVTRIDAQGYPAELVPVPDEAVRWEWVPNAKRWDTYVDHKKMDRWPLGPLWHCPLYVAPGVPMGYSPIAHHAETIGVGLAAAQFGGQFFGEGGHPTMVIESEKDPGPGGATKLKDRILAITRGSREPLVLPKGVKLTKWQVNPDESQFLDTMRYSGEDVCRVFGVPPGKIYLAISGQNVTYTNTAAANADWRVSGLARYTGALEGHLSRLRPAGRNRKLKFNFKGFLRADTKTRYEIYKLATEIGKEAGVPVMFVNEMRAEEGLPPVEGGDEFNRVLTPEPTQQRNEDANSN